MSFWFLLNNETNILEINHHKLGNIQYNIQTEK